MSFDITAYKQVYVSAPGSWAYDTAFSRIPNGEQCGMRSIKLVVLLAISFRYIPAIDG